MGRGNESIACCETNGGYGFDGIRSPALARSIASRSRPRWWGVDTEGLLQALNVHAANIRDRDGIKLVVSEAVHARLTRMQALWLDAGYNGRGKGKDWVEQIAPWRVETVKALYRYKYY
jgi:hypothetical protein